MSSFFLSRRIIISSYIICIILLTINVKIIKGNFKSTLMNATYCVDPKPPYEDMDKRVLISTIEIYVNKAKRKIVRGNLTVLGNTSGVMGRLSYGVQNGNNIRWKYNLIKINCHLLFSNVLKGLKSSIPMNSKTCMIKKGTYEVLELDIAKLDATFYLIPQRDYGLITWMFMMYTSHGTNVCYIIKMLVTK